MIHVLRLAADGQWSVLSVVTDRVKDDFNVESRSVKEYIEQYCT